MERAIGAVLLNRGRRGVTLTPAGQLLREHATTLLAQVERMRGDLTRFAEGLVASVRLQANTAASETFLPGQLVAFLRQRPEIDIDLRERPSARIVHALARGHTDLGIVASSVDTGSLICEPLIDDYLVLAVPRGHEVPADRARGGPSPRRSPGPARAPAQRPPTSPSATSESCRRLHCGHRGSRSGCRAKARRERMAIPRRARDGRVGRTLGEPQAPHLPRAEYSAVSRRPRPARLPHRRLARRGVMIGKAAKVTVVRP